MTNAAVQSNRTHNGFNRLPYKWFKGEKRRLNGSERAILSAVYSFSAENSATFKYADLEERFKMSHATVARSISRLMQDGLLARENKLSHYTCAESGAGKDEYNKIPSIRIEEWLYLANFGTELAPEYLTKLQVEILSLIRTHAERANGKGEFYGSYRAIARILDLDPSTVSKAIARLKGLQIIFTRPAPNGKRYSVFTVHSSLLREAKKQIVKTLPKVTAPVNRIEEADRRAERESYYSALQARAQTRKEAFEATLRRDGTYEKAERELRTLEISIVKAELAGASDLALLRQKEMRLKATMAARMAALGISSEDLRPTYVCQKCSDTGVLPNGRYCNCYEEQRRRR